MLEKEDWIALAHIFQTAKSPRHIAQMCLEKAGVAEPPKWYEIDLGDEVRKRIHQALYELEIAEDETTVLVCKFCGIANGHSFVCPTKGLADTVSNAEEFITKVKKMLKEKGNGLDPSGTPS